MNRIEVCNWCTSFKACVYCIEFKSTNSDISITKLYQLSFMYKEMQRATFWEKSQVSYSYSYRSISEAVLRSVNFVLSSSAYHGLLTDKILVFRLFKWQLRISFSWDIALHPWVFVAWCSDTMYRPHLHQSMAQFFSGPCTFEAEAINMVLKCWQINIHWKSAIPPNNGILMINCPLVCFQWYHIH
jgi:hypothetical protein